MDDHTVHRKRLAQILRYIASMHQSLNPEATAHHPFVRFQREAEEEVEGRCGVLFTTRNFRQLLRMQETNSTPLFAHAPFAFYAATSTDDDRKRTLSGAIKSTFGRRAVVGPEKVCWLRLTRLTASQLAEPSLRQYPSAARHVQEWLAQTPGVSTVQDLLTLERLEQAPKVSPTLDASQVRQFLRLYRQYLRRRLYQQTLEPMYNALFEWMQHQSDHYAELVFGLGQARMRTDDTVVNGPLLEVLVEVELAADGALLLRPRQHTGVALNREVVSALCDNGVVLSQLHRTVAELEASQLCPAQPATYVPVLKRMAVELSPGGCFRPSSAPRSKDSDKLVVSEAWCLYTRPKPSSVWARDATAFADELAQATSRLELPLAAWSLTHGPGALEQILQSQAAARMQANKGGNLLDWLQSKVMGAAQGQVAPAARPLFALPTSNTQKHIAELLLTQNYPAVVCEGPPGSGKSHTIANIIGAYLSQGKRVLVTSKNAPALSVLRGRLPASVQELCVDVSMSELAGMRQLQKTVERLANRVSVANTEMETRKCEFLQNNIDELTAQLESIDEKICRQSDRVRSLLQHPNGERLCEIAYSLIDSAPWLMASISTWDIKQVMSLRKDIARLVVQDGDPTLDVSGFDEPPTEALVSLCRAMAGSPVYTLSNAMKSAVASVPLLGSLTGMAEHTAVLQESLERLMVQESQPKAKSEWETVAAALTHSRALHNFVRDTWRTHQRKEGWPELDLFDRATLRSLEGMFDKSVEFKELVAKLDASKEVKMALECRSLDSRRSKLAVQIQHMAEELVDATVVTELSRAFSPDAQSALIQFSQIAGKAKFSRSSQPSKMTQRQRRRRQEYLDAFDRCCRFIPCWILTSSQISDYLPAEGLFDLVIIDEASQSDVTVLPTMLRGKQWLIVGDGKQVSPTESFVSEEQIDSLRAALPSSPLESSLLPGQSFFDLCAQAFPRGRVVLSEHFRCAEEIIAFSNDQFYDNRLVPLRLPTKSERLTPAVVDVFVRNGVKKGKVNEREAERIVALIKEAVTGPEASTRPRSIGVISLIGDEQSRLIRGRLLDEIGAEKMARHDVLVGDPPSFQGAERDIIFLSMVCSKGSVPTQNQLMHFQRVNVAMSRARDRCVLVRSIDLADVPSRDDVKLPVIEYFQTFANAPAAALEEQPEEDIAGSGREGARLLKKLLSGRGFHVRDMGAVWKNAICIEHADADTRAGVMIDCDGESQHEWRTNYHQQKAIERVGWKCLRLDSLCLLSDSGAAMGQVLKFLADCGIHEPIPVTEESDNEEEMEDEEEEEVIEIGPNHAAAVDLAGDQNGPVAALDAAANADDNANSDDEVVVISDGESIDAKPAAAQPIAVRSESFGPDEEVDAAQFGEVVQLDFLREGEDDEDDMEAAPLPIARLPPRLAERPNGEESVSSYDDSDGENAHDRASRRRRKYRRLDHYSRDGRYYPGNDEMPKRLQEEAAGSHKDWYDTDSDLQDGEGEKDDAWVPNEVGPGAQVGDSEMDET